jgi:hypothetical protein
MLIVDDKIVIAHMRKCGGTAFCLGLIEQLPPERTEYLGYTVEGELRSKEKYRKREVWKHSSAIEILNYYDISDPYVMLVSYRPYHQRVASFYFHCLRHNARDPKKYAWVHGKSFGEYLISKHAKLETVPHFACDDAGDPVVDEIVPFDQIAQRYDVLARELGLAKRSMPKLNVNPEPQDYRTLYGADDWEIVRPTLEAEREFMQQWTRRSVGDLESGLAV